MKVKHVCLFGIIILASYQVTANEAVYSPNDFGVKINQVLKLPQPIFTTPTPAVVIIDIKTQKILSSEETLALINKNILVKAQKLNELPKYLNHIDKFSFAKIAESALSIPKRFYILFNNPPKYQIKMMNKMLKVKMQETIEKVGASISKLDAHVIFNAQGVTNEYFKQ